MRNKPVNLPAFLKPLTICLNFLIIVYFAGAALWVSDIYGTYDALYEPIITVLNPFTIGAYVLGVVMLLNYIVFDKIVIKITLSVLYILNMLFSFVGVMGAYELKDYLIYLPHAFIIVMAVCIVVYKRKNGQGAL